MSGPCEFGGSHCGLAHPLGAAGHCLQQWSILGQGHSSRGKGTLLWGRDTAVGQGHPSQGTLVLLLCPCPTVPSGKHPGWLPRHLPRHQQAQDIPEPPGQEICPRLCHGHGPRARGCRTEPWGTRHGLLGAWRCPGRTGGVCPVSARAAGPGGSSEHRERAAGARAGGIRGVNFQPRRGSRELLILARCFSCQSERLLCC